ncbi:MAG: hypothetical protein ACOX1F_00970 [Erysipelotrichaceae bacterium]|jgi:hypothetical protein
MKNELFCDVFEKYQTIRLITDGEIKYAFRFENDYGAVVVKNRYSFGYDDDLFEMCLLYKGQMMNNTFIKSNKKVNSVSMGYLTNDEVLEILEQIKEFK